jgi:ABC-type antimicrobial peptide transport system permease subunit
LASYLVVRTTGDPVALVRSVRARLAEAVPGLVVRDVATLPERVGRMLVRPRFTLALVAGFALVALLLAGIGTYGTIAYLIVRRTREVGVRIALGADPPAVVRLIVRQGMLPVVVGLAAGMVGASVATQSIASLIPGVGPRDPTTFGTAAVVLALVGSVAAYLPARRATRIDPMEALRNE